jgi:hypothetical protein
VPFEHHGFKPNLSRGNTPRGYIIISVSSCGSKSQKSTNYLIYLPNLASFQKQNVIAGCASPGKALEFSGAPSIVPAGGAAGNARPGFILTQIRHVIASPDHDSGL